MPDNSTTLYDQAQFGTTAAVVHPLFQSREGSTATRTKFITNSRGDGSLPNNEQFTINKISVFVDDETVVADLKEVWENSYLEIVVEDKSILQIPLRLCAEGNSFGGLYTQAAAADEEAIGISGNGYQLAIPIVLRGGSSFRVNLGQGFALSAATEMKCVLHGTLSTS